MVKKIFISRDLNSDSPFFTALDQHHFEIIGQSLLRFFPIPFSSIPNSNWLFFYSQKGAAYFFQQLNHPLPDAFRIAALGPATAKAIQSFRQVVHFIGDGHPASTAQSFQLLAQNQSVTFIQAKFSRQSVQRLLEDQLTANKLIVYDNQPIDTPELPSCDILVFTSPLNAQTYFKHAPLLDHQTVIAIGPTTATTLYQLGIQQVLTAPSPNEKALVQLIQNL